jgi:hypothetical protein
MKPFTEIQILRKLLFFFVILQTQGKQRKRKK